MSAWSEWKCGALTDQEYRMECMIEARKDEAMYDEPDDEPDDDETER